VAVLATLAQRLLGQRALVREADPSRVQEITTVMTSRPWARSPSAPPSNHEPFLSESPRGLFFLFFFSVLLLFLQIGPIAASWNIANLPPSFVSAEAGQLRRCGNLWSLATACVCYACPHISHSRACESPQSQLVGVVRRSDF
jgi:hypothetical protein